jgi:hypothetical protein
MNASWKNRLPLLAVVGLVVVAVVVLARWQPAHAARADGPVTGPRYTVVMTEGHNLIVTDNGTNTLHFYTIDKDKEIGSDLHLRGSVDLSQVGKDTIKPMNVKRQK